MLFRSDPPLNRNRSLALRHTHDNALLADWRRAHPELASRAPGWVQQLVLAADAFVVRRGSGHSLLAGYPWFGDWGRDTMITLPGLTLATGRFDTALRVLRTFARFVDRGMLPNVFPGAGEAPEYNTVDAALWYLEAWRAYMDFTDDRAALARVAVRLTRLEPSASMV